MVFKRVAGFGQTEALPRRQTIDQPRPIQQQGESPLGTVGRNVAREGIRNLPLIAGAVNPTVGAGLLGAEFLQGISPYLSSGHISPERIAQERGVENPEQYAFQGPNVGEYLSNPIDYLPTGANISRGLEPYFPEGYLQPQSQGEQALGDFTTFAGSALNPLLGGAGKTLGQAATRGALGAAGGVAARGAGLEGLPETIVKTLTAAAPDLKTIFTAPAQVADQVKQGYDAAKQFGKSLVVPGEKIKNAADTLAARAKRLGNTPASKALYKNARRLSKLADKNGNYSATDLVDFKQSINELYGKGMEKVVHDINAPILSELKGLSGKQPVFDIFNRLYFGAEEGWQALNTVGRVGEFIDKYISPVGKTGAGFIGLKQLFAGDFLGAATTAGATVASKAIGKAGIQFIDFIDRSPQGQKLLIKMITDIGNDAKEPAIRDFNHLNRLYEKDMRKEKRESEKKGNFKRVSPDAVPF